MTNEERDELLVRVDERVTSIHSRLEKGDTRLDNHGKRISVLERWRSAVVAVVAVVLMFIGVKLRTLF